LLEDLEQNWNISTFDGEDVGKIPFQRRCGLVLSVAGQGKDWYKSWLLSPEDITTFRANLFTKMDKAGVTDNTVSWDEFEAFCIRHEREIQNSPSRFHGLLYHDVRERAFDRFDLDGNNRLEFDEFDRFLSDLDREYFKYLLRAELVSFRAYWGRGMIPPSADGPMPEEEDPMVMLKAMLCIGADTEPQQSSSYAQIAETESGPPAPHFSSMFLLGREKDTPLHFGMFAPGWWEDFKYFSANNHPLHGIFMCDWYHPLDWKERLMMELSTWCYSWISLWVLGRHHDVFEDLHDLARFFHMLPYTILFAMLPGIIWWHVLRLLYAMPCANMDETRTSVAEVHQTRKIRRASEIVAHILVLTTWCLPLAFLPFPHGVVIMHVVLVRVKAYLLTWMLFLLIPFNPLLTIGNPNPLTQQTTLCKVLGKLGIGKWRLQKLQFNCLGCYGHRRMEEYLPPSRGSSASSVPGAVRGSSAGSSTPKRRHIWSLYAKSRSTLGDN
jgi:hypothetical protein